MNTTAGGNNAAKFSGEGESESLETRIGLYWLHRFGIICLVFGIVFLIICSFQYFGPLQKLATGFITSFVLIFLGRSMEQKEKSRWFAHGLKAGGWSIAYFSTYAAYYLPVVKVVSSLTLESILLLAVAAGSLVSALRARSELMAIYSLTLAAVSTIISGASLLSDISFVIIAATAAILGNKLAWRKLFAYGMASCYLGHLCSAAHARSLQDYNIASCCLGAIWLVFSVGLACSVHRCQQARKFITILSSLNAIALSTGLALFSVRGAEQTCQMILAFAGSVCLAAARWLHKRNEGQLSSVHSLLGLSLINVAKMMHFSGEKLLALDIMEIALLGALGARYDVKSFRWFALFLSFSFFGLWIPDELRCTGDKFMGFQAFTYVRIALSATMVFASLSLLHIRRKNVLALPKFYGDFYYFAANAILLLAFNRIDNLYWLACGLVIQAAMAYFICIELDNWLYALPGWLCTYIAAIVLLVAHSWNTAAIGVIVVSLYVAHAVIGYLSKHRLFSKATRIPSNMSIVLKTGYAHAANIMLTLFILKQVQSNYVSPALALEGIGLLLSGFICKNRLFRISGLIVLALLTGKLFLVDFAKFNTIERVSAFVVAGVVFLLSSYVYAFFTRSFEEVPTTASAPEPECDLISETLAG